MHTECTKNSVGILYTHNEELEIKNKIVPLITKGNEILRCKSNKLCARSLCCKLQKTDESHKLGHK